MTQDCHESLKHYLDNPGETPGAEWVEEMKERYPYFALPAILRLQRCDNLDEEEKSTLARRAAIRYSSRKSLYDLIGEQASQYASFYPAETTKPLDTETTIDRFLDTYGANDQNEIKALSSLIFNPVGDYRFDEDDIPQNDTPKTEQDSLIDRFLDGSDDTRPADGSPATPPAIPLPPPIPEVVCAEREDPGTLSESLAKIYIKQKKYSKAYQILQEVLRQHPEQNHLQDQLRFLRKLMAATGK